mmetsp:Transcript_59835/g.142534  ORF Transcript_59835/g.142534 Transcript_59835/m.142534 type:complete len:391 (+) Transcript_59835:475-1647(+)
MDVVLAHLSDVLKHEAHALQHAVLHIELWHSVFIHQRRQNCERATCLCNDGDSNRCADTQLSLLHFQVVQQSAQHIVRTDRLGNVAKGVHCRTTNGLLVCLQQLQQIKANAVPFTRWCQFCTSICNPSNKVNAIFLNLLVSVLQDRRQARQQILHRRSHLCHANDVDNSLHGAQDGTQHLGILFAQVLIQEETQVAHHLLLATLLHDDCNASNQVCSLLSHSCRWCVQAPPDDASNLRQVWLHTGPQRVHHGAEAIEHHRGVIGSLLLERVDDSIYDLLFQAGVDIRHTKVCNGLVNGLHDHLPVGFRGILQIFHNPRDDVRTTHLVCNLHCGVDELAVVSSIQGHTYNPEVAEERWQDVFTDVVWLHSIRCNALLHHLEDNLLHFLIRR